MPLSTQQTVELLEESQKRFPVEQWTADGIEIWPIYRLTFSSMNDEAWLKTVLVRPRFDKTRKILQAVWAQLQGLRAGTDEYIRHNTVSVFMLSDGTPTFQLPSGQWFETLCDPFGIEFKKSGLNSITAMRGYLYHLPKFSPTYLYQFGMEANRFVSRLTDKPCNFVLPRYAEWQEFVRITYGEIRFPTVNDLAADISIIRSYAKSYKKLLASWNCKLALATCYYNYRGMGLILACKELGIKTVDIQHGFQGDHHVAYSDFGKIPPEGYKLLPDIFWIWGAREEAVIRRWSDASNGAHRPLIGGNLFLQTCMDDDNPLVKQIAPEVEKIKIAGKRHALYTIGAETLEQMREILNAIKLSRARNFHWWVRLHPGFPLRRDEIKRAFAREGITVEVDKPSVLPLYVLLRHADVLLTRLSSTVIEAAHMGVPSVLAGEDSAIYFPEQTANRMAVEAILAQDIASALEAQCARFPRAKRNVILPAQNQGITELLKLAGLQ